jgi:GTP cyclohydrolase I
VRDTEALARALLESLGLPETEATKDTPRRLVAALVELTAGLRTDPDRHLLVTFPPESPDPGMILVAGVPFVSLCEHHMLPFTGTATVAYLPAPGARIVGLSKLARVVSEYAARPQIQERLGDQIVRAITGNLDTLGAACMIRAAHSCLTLRGAKAVGAEMVTSHLAGRFRDDPSARGEFLALAAP